MLLRRIIHFGGRCHQLAQPLEPSGVDDVQQPVAAPEPGVEGRRRRPRRGGDPPHRQVGRDLLAQQPQRRLDQALGELTTNLFRDGLRRGRRLRVDALGDDTDPVVDRAPSPADMLEDRTLDTDVVDALDALPSHFRSAVLLRDLHGLPYDQVAALLGIKVGTVRSRLHRGRAQLRTAPAHRARRPGTGIPSPAAA